VAAQVASKSRSIDALGRLPVLGLFLLLLWLPFMETSPTAVGWREAVYAALFMLTLGAWAVRSLLVREVLIYRSAVSAAVFLLLGVCLASLPVALGNGVEPGLWLRGIFPFLNLIMFYPAVDSIEPRDMKPLLWVMLAAALIFAARTLYVFASMQLWRKVYFVAYREYFSYRVTWLCPTSTVSYPIWGAVVAALLAAYGKTWRAVVLFTTLAAVFATAVLLSYTRSMLLTMALTAGLVAFLLWKYQGRLALKPSRAGLILLCCAGLLAVLVAVKSGTFQILLSRLDALNTSKAASAAPDTNVSARLEEWRVGWRLFREAPLWGKGLGFQHTIPMDVGPPGHVKMALITKGYVHNFLVYFLMDTGLVGALSYLFVIGAGLAELKRAIASARGEEGLLTLALLAVFVATFAYSLVFAEFRLFAFNLLVAVVLAAAVRLRIAAEGVVSSPACRKAHAVGPAACRTEAGRGLV
jgi:O-antigen ligase